VIVCLRKIWLTK